MMSLLIKFKHNFNSSLCANAKKLPNQSQEMAEIQWSMTKSYAGLENRMITLPNAIEVNLSSGLSENVWTVVTKLETRKRQ